MRQQLLLVVLALQACGGEVQSEAPVDGAPPSPVPVEELFDRRAVVSLEERDEVITVLPVVQGTRSGDLLVADLRENQIRLYARDGGLKRHFGRRGDGPGEFRALQGATMTGDGRILGVDTNGRMSLFDALGVHERTVPGDLAPIQEVQGLEASRVLVTAPLRENRLGPQLHIVDVETGGIEAAFFTPTIPPGVHPAVAAMVAWGAAAVRGDTIAAAFSFSDTVHVFTREGEPLRALHVPLPGYRGMATPLEEFGADPRAPIRWIASFDLISRVRWTRDGNLLVQFQTMDPEGRFTYQILHMTAEGRLLGHSVDTPRFVGQADDATFFFLDPGAETPDRWLALSLQSP